MRHEILQKIKKQVQLYLGNEPKAIRSYALAYKKDIERGRWRPSTERALSEALKTADVVFGGDFHAFSQAQRVHLRNLRNIEPYKKIILGLECVPSRFQKTLDQFMGGKLSESDFLKKVNWEKNWGFPWGQYKPLLDLVRESGGKCLALNKLMPQKSLADLRARDKHAVDLLNKAYLSKSKEESIYVIYGDLHIAQEHLPSLFKKSVKKKMAPQIVTVYLNPEKIYFQMLKKNMEHQVPVIQFSKNEFCLLESPPWVKWQSYLIFLEETSDESLYEDDGAVDYSEHVHALLKLMASDLNLECPGETTVHSFNDHDFLDLLAIKVSKENFSFIKRFVQNDIAFYEPGGKRAFLPRGTVNYAAHLAGHIFHSELCQRQQFIFDFPGEFVHVIWFEAMAFFLSKLVNPHRKSLGINDLKKQLAAFSPGEQGEETLKLALDQKMRDLVLVYGKEIVSSQIRKKQDPLTFYKAGKLLGSMMGERIYLAFKSGRLSRSTLLAWLTEPVRDQKFQNFYIQVLKDLDNIESGGAGG